MATNKLHAQLASNTTFDELNHASSGLVLTDTMICAAELFLDEARSEGDLTQILRAAEMLGEARDRIADAKRKVDAVIEASAAGRQ